MRHWTCLYITHQASSICQQLHITEKGELGLRETKNMEKNIYESDDEGAGNEKGCIYVYNRPLKYFT